MPDPDEEATTPVTGEQVLKAQDKMMEASQKYLDAKAAGASEDDLDELGDALGEATAEWEKKLANWAESVPPDELGAYPEAIKEAVAAYKDVGNWSKASADTGIAERKEKRYAEAFSELRKLMGIATAFDKATPSVGTSPSTAKPAVKPGPDTGHYDDSHNFGWGKLKTKPIVAGGIFAGAAAAILAGVAAATMLVSGGSGGTTPNPGGSSLPGAEADSPLASLPGAGDTTVVEPSVNQGQTLGADPLPEIYTLEQQQQDMAPVAPSILDVPPVQVPQFQVPQFPQVVEQPPVVVAPPVVAAPQTAAQPPNAGISGNKNVGVGVQSNGGNHPAPLVSLRTVNALAERFIAQGPTVEREPGDPVKVTLTINGVALVGNTVVGPGFSETGGNFTATTTAPYQGYNTTWTFQGTLGPGPSGLSGTLTIGGDGKLPGGRPIVYSIQGQ